MDDYELSRREREADEALYAVDPDLARELGYAPPPAPDPAVRAQMEATLSKLAANYVGPQQLGAVAAQNAAVQHQQMLSAHQGGILGAFGAILGGAVGGVQGSAAGRTAVRYEVGRRFFPPDYR